MTYERVLREFGRQAEQARRAYRRFVAEGMTSRLIRPWEDAAYGLIIGGETFVDRVRQLLSGRPADPSLPTLRSLRPRPTISQIVAAVAEVFGADPRDWAQGRRIDDGSRAAAAYLARRRYGYRAREVAEALGYTSHGGVLAAVRRMEEADGRLQSRLKKAETMLASS